MFVHYAGRPRRSPAARRLLDLLRLLLQLNSKEVNRIVNLLGDGGTNAAVGDDTLETERPDSQSSQAGPYLTGSAQKY